MSAADRCYDVHRRVGIVTNQPDGYDRTRPHAARNVCARTECIEKALAWVRETTGEPGVHITDASRRAKAEARP